MLILFIFCNRIYAFIFVKIANKIIYILVYQLFNVYIYIYKF